MQASVCSQASSDPRFALKAHTHARGNPHHSASALCASSTTGTDQSTNDLKWARELRGRVSMARNATRHRSLDISLEHRAELVDGSVVQGTAVYAMSVNE